tara:strand:+ start:169 stop:873 length:705 start_codon:yes stop_codon:yes gene_type:complete
MENVSNRRFDYESKLATQQGLIQLGGQLNQLATSKENRLNKLEKIKKFIEDASNLRSCDYRGRLLVDLFNIYKATVTEYEKEIKLLKEENKDNSDMADNYIEQLDEIEKELNVCNETLRNKNNSIDGYIKQCELNKKIIKGNARDINYYIGEIKFYKQLLDNREEKEKKLKKSNNKLIEEIRNANKKAYQKLKDANTSIHKKTLPYKIILAVLFISYYIQYRHYVYDCLLWVFQ